MPQEWEHGNAARQPAYDPNSTPNPFTPVDYAARLKTAPDKRRQANARTYTPPVPSAPPMAAPGYGVPQYMQQPANYQPPVQNTPAPYAQQGYPQQNVQGAPYSAALFDHQPTAVMPSGQEAVPFADRTAIDFWKEPSAWQQPQQPEVQPEPAPVYYSAADVPLRDPFTPAKPREDSKAQTEQPEAETDRQEERPPIRIGRLLALIAAGVMLCICLLVGGRMISELVNTEREARDHEQNGMQVYNGAAKVELLPPGQTYKPTDTPEPTLFVPTPSPTPIIPLDNLLIPGFSNTNPDAVRAAEVTPTPVMRTRLTTYPKNPMRNVSESLREMVAENADVIGRLVIDGVLDEMVMQRNNTYYLTHNSAGSPSDSGAVFADQSCVLRNPPENLLLRGQSAVPGKVFAPLWQFVSGGSSFVSTHMYAHLTSLYEEESYVLIAVLVVDINPTGSRYFNYASNPTFTTDEAMLQYVAKLREHSVYNFTVDVNASDRLLTLATLGNSDTNLVLVYRMLRDGEYGI